VRLQRNCDVNVSLELLPATRGLRSKLESLSSSAFSDGGPLHFILNFLFSDQRYLFVPTTMGNQPGAFVDRVSSRTVLRLALRFVPPLRLVSLVSVRCVAAARLAVVPTHHSCCRAINVQVWS
jgi:hypothetical protein